MHTQKIGTTKNLAYPLGIEVSENVNNVTVAQASGSLIIHDFRLYNDYGARGRTEEAIMSNDQEQILFEIDLNNQIDRHLRRFGARNLHELIENIEALSNADIDINDDAETQHYALYLDEQKLFEMTLPSLILSHAVIKKMNVFDISTIIADLNISMDDYVDAFEGIDIFDHITPSGQRVDPLTLSAGALQGVALDPRALQRFKSTAHHSYMRFNTLVASGAAGDFCAEVFRSDLRSKRIKIDFNDLALGSLTYLESLDHLPNRSIDQFLQSSGLLEYEVLRKTHPCESAWEQLICTAGSDFRGNEFANQVLKHLLSDEFLSEFEDQVACLINNIVDLSFYEFGENPALYRHLLEVANTSRLKEMFSQPHVMLNMVGESILSNRAGYLHVDQFKSLLDELDAYGPDLLSATLEKALEVPSHHVGVSMFRLPRLVQIYAQGVPQIVDPARVAKFFDKVLVHHQQWLASNANESHYKEDKPEIIDGLSYLFGLPGVQAEMAPYLKDLSAQQSNLFIQLGLELKNIKNPTDKMMSDVFSRDLGL